MYDTSRREILGLYVILSFAELKKTWLLQSCMFSIRVSSTNTIPEWELICITYLRLSSRPCKSLSLSHQPSQQLATSKCLTHCICVAHRPDCHDKGKAQGNSHSLEPLYTYVNGGSWSAVLNKQHWPKHNFRTVWYKT